MTNLTNHGFNRITRAVEIASNQGFKMIKIDGTESPFEFDLTCIYGDTLEVYRVKVNTYHKSYDCYQRLN